MMVGKSFKIGDLVWVKQPGQDIWPGRIEKPPKDLHPPSKKGYHFVKFFNTNKSVWLKTKAIVLHSEEMLQSSSKRKSASLKKAIEEITSLSQKDKKNGCESQKLDLEVNKSAMPLNSNASKEEVQENQHLLTSNSNPPFVMDVDKSSDKKEIGDTEVSPSPKLDEHVENNESVDISSSVQADDPVALEQADVVMTSIDTDLLINSTASEPCPSKQVDSSESLEKSDVMSSVDAAGLLQNSPTPGLCIIEQPTSLPDDATLRGEAVDQVYHKIGFLGLGRMGSAIVRDLMMAGYDVTVWNRTMEKCKFFVFDGAHQGDSPSDVVAKCDITFSCVSDPEASKLLVFGPQGVLHGFEGSEQGSKGYIELSSNDPFTSEEIGKAISDAGGLYLEAPVSLSKEPEKDKLMIIAAGNRDLFDKCVLYFRSISKTTYFLGTEVGSASKLNVVIGSLHGTLYGLLAESLKLAEKNNLSPNIFLSFLDQGADLPTYFFERGKAMIDHNFSVNTTVKHQHKLNSFALSLDADNQSLNLAAEKLSLSRGANVSSSPETENKSLSQDADNISSILGSNNESEYVKLLIAYCTQRVLNVAQEKYSEKDISAVYMSI